MDYSLRELTRADLVHITKWRNNPELIQHLCSPFRFIDEEVDTLWFNKYLESRARNIRLAICKKNSGEIVGAVYLLDIDWLHKNAEFGILIGDESAQGKGAGEFATRGILQHAFMDLNLHRVNLVALVSNERALRLYRKIGFVDEGISREALFKNGVYVDIVRMAILVGEYMSSDSKNRIVNCP